MPETKGLAVADIAEHEKYLEQHQPRLQMTIERRLDRDLATSVAPLCFFPEPILPARRVWPRLETRRSTIACVWRDCVVLDQLVETWRRETRSPCNPPRDISRPELQGRNTQENQPATRLQLVPFLPTSYRPQESRTVLSTSGAMTASVPLFTYSQETTGTSS